VRQGASSVSVKYSPTCTGWGIFDAYFLPVLRNKYKPDKHRHYWGDVSMPREVIIKNTVFVVNSYSCEDAIETVDDILKRVIIKNAEVEFKKRQYSACDNSHDN